ncbi:preQ(1) synthase [Candidatus Deianiraea vastatrix]|uniref:NADPH-dependent 7-cyano-7-deazaguanine reductase n=1 Tax=Candidatus Deianiraea vastatrix TaxID=2163644 RepID=A0A5B8XE36_9RICK|nr:preQ(1) synthase [Candidatus Deianiraea vastatrix]QED23135.1 NADPH-dependent 7-cyano-7-deazaguanine reductase [Candidatus Deianiraea vastatrix]
MSIGNYDNLTQLGSKVLAESDPKLSQLEVVQNPHKNINYVARFSTREFTSLCPITGQPDYAVIVIDYVPDEYIVESKSLKLFLQSFRNHGDFHEACTIYIAQRLIDIAKPKWLRICAYWAPRGGIPIDVFYQTGEAPNGVFIESTDEFRRR